MEGEECYETFSEGNEEQGEECYETNKYKLTDSMCQATDCVW